jgi:hypothetical protein
MSLEPTSAEFHDVSDGEADACIESCRHAIPINELIGRLLRNMYGRLKIVEKENLFLKGELAQFKAKSPRRDA